MTSPISSLTTQVLHVALAGLDQRQAAISDNIANLETPGYLAKEVDFEASLRQAIAEGNPFGTSVDVSRSLAATRLNGNNVNIDMELLSSSETQLRQSLAIQALNGQYNLLRTAITG